MHSLLIGAGLLAEATTDSFAFVIWDKIWPIALMLLGFSFIVFVHELGHFAVAKWAGVRVIKFAIGFGKELFGFTRGETRYSFNMLPLGGYVKMLGQEDFDDKANELKFKQDPRSFVNKPISHRMAIVSAGVIMNAIFAFILFVIVFMVGLDVPTTKIGFVEPDSAADVAGLRRGDDIKRINDERILDFNSVSTAVLLATPHEPLSFIIERDGVRIRIPVKPEHKPELGHGQIGIQPGITQTIGWVAPGFDKDDPSSPRINDVLVEIEGQPVTDQNIDVMFKMLAYGTGNAVVERGDPDDPNAPVKRVSVKIPPNVALFPVNSVRSAPLAAPPVHLLGLTPLARFDTVDPDGIAAKAGIEVGDTILKWGEKTHPTHSWIARLIRDCPGQQIEFAVRKPNGESVTGFVSPERKKKGRPTVHARCVKIPEEQQTKGGPRAKFVDVRENGQAAEAGIANGFTVLKLDGVENPTAAQVSGAVRKKAGRRIKAVFGKLDGSKLTTVLRPESPGTIGANIRLIAEDFVRVGEVVETINGRQSPAAAAGIRGGSMIVSVDGQAIARWQDLIDRFREVAGSDAEVVCEDDSGQRYTVRMPIPRCVRTELGVGPEAEILSMADRGFVHMKTRRGMEDVRIGHHEGLRELLTQLLDEGKSRAKVTYRPNPAAETQVAEIEIDEAMVDPWLGRVRYRPKVALNTEMKLLQADSAIDAIGMGLQKTYYFIRIVYRSISALTSGTVGMENMSGPLGIVKIGGDVARNAGPMKFLFFLALISVNLAVLNFLPLPIVDGGLMVFLIVEKIKGSPVSLRVQVATQMVGLVLIISAFIFVTFNDALQIWG